MTPITFDETLSAEANHSVVHPPKVPIGTNAEKTLAEEGFDVPLAPPGHFNDISDEDYVKDSDLLPEHCITTIDPED